MAQVRSKLSSSSTEYSPLKAFQALYYNSSKIKDIQKVFAPPYDVISDEDREMYMKSSPYNFVHLDLSKELAGDTAKNNKYMRAKKLFEQFIKDDILTKDSEPSIYIYKQEYKSVGQKYNRIGFISLLKLDHDTTAKIHPHEKTHEKAVQDRLTLTKTLNASLSPIFVCYSDKQKTLETIVNKKIASTTPGVGSNPVFDFHS